MLKFLLLALLSTLAATKVTWPKEGAIQCQQCPMNFFNNSVGLARAGIIIAGQSTVTTTILLPPEAAIPNANGTFSFILNVPAGTSVSVQVIDNDGVTTQTPFITVQVSETSNCLPPTITSNNSTIIPSTSVTAVAVLYSGGKTSNSLSAGAIAGIVIGSVVGGLLIGLGIYFLLRSKKSSTTTGSTTPTDPVLYTSPHNSVHYSSSPSTNYTHHTSLQSQSPHSPQSATFSNNVRSSHLSSGTGTSDLDDPQNFSPRNATGYSGNVMREISGGSGGHQFPSEAMDS